MPTVSSRQIRPRSPVAFHNKAISLAESWGSSQGERNEGEGWFNQRR